MRAADQVQAWFAGLEGQVLLTVENTYRPELNGVRRRITKLGRSFYDAVLLDDAGTSQKAGSQCRGHIPLRARDIVAINDDELTSRLGDIERLAGHTVTMRKVAA